LKESEYQRISLLLRHHLRSRELDPTNPTRPALTAAALIEWYLQMKMMAGEVEAGQEEEEMRRIRMILNQIIKDKKIIVIQSPTSLDPIGGTRLLMVDKDFDETNLDQETEKKKMKGNRTATE